MSVTKTQKIAIKGQTINFMLKSIAYFTAANFRVRVV